MTEEQAKKDLSRLTVSELVERLLFAYRTISMYEKKIREAMASHEANKQPIA